MNRLRSASHAVLFAVRTFSIISPLAFIGCPATAPVVDEGEGEDEGGGDVVYFRDILPLLERSCFGCHQAGGIAPFAFDDPESAQALAPAILDAVDRGVMPPYYARQDCRETTEDTRLTAPELELLRAWTNDGAPLGDAADAVHAEPIAPPTMRVDATYDIGVDFDVQTLTEDAADFDVYRCFDIDLGLASDTAITAYEVLPDNAPLVHHVLAYTVAPDKVAELRDLDDAEPGAGYNCESGGVGVSGAIANLAVSWVPGATVSRMPEGTGIQVPAGSHLVFQIHYNLLAVGDDPFDRTSFVLETAAPAGLERLRIIPALYFNLDIQAGDAESVQSNILPAPLNAFFRGARITSASGHMHQLGTSVRLEVLRGGVDAGDGNDCVLHVDPWDFNWQRNYTFAVPVDINDDDRLRITCVYDNSAANQAFVDGVQLAPRDVAWGENSLDEMCMVYLSFTGGGGTGGITLP